ncbi:Subtilase family protein [Micromonospora echinaurantiaca]|uniref:Subtilase family protein n=1 Tax=Micromonospora echinaurantiaca TaxID=47857 RepID=A0A1C5IFL9_9ACTN|nr:Subtilase family protein [Micromonospora echinaurantiaca]
MATQGFVPAAASSATAPFVTAKSGDGGRVAWVTLVTGDRALVRGSGTRADVVVDPAPRFGVTQFQQFSRGGDRYVLPGDAAGLVRAGVLDLELFNVTGLVRQGYDDAHSASVPLLVQYTKGRAAAGASKSAGATVRRLLPGVALMALDEKKATASQFWTQTLTVAGDGAAGSTGSGARRLSNGIGRVWLNGKVWANLDQSVPQVGAPAAWSRGLTGAGITVAVLDTGVDTDHPDLVGRVGPTKDFSGKGNVEDGNGHGTHVASTVGGVGAASQGAYKGVAPGARLAVGKVLDDTGFGTFDSVIAGMQWAAAESGAKVVNMSLGAGRSDGTDPVSVAVNELTRQHGTLFVISAGNSGVDEAVSSPAVADEALAVASVSKSDRLSDFSSRGPRIGDGALKPDVAAPGEDIVAARPANIPPLGEPVGDGYQRLNGTSMAAPHVAGAAALLAQQHPDWTAGRLKAALMSTAAEVTEVSPYAVGAGRVDVARATSQPVTALGSVSTYLPWPNQGVVKRQTLTWRNTGTAPVTLALAARLTRRDGEPAPVGLLSLAADTVTIPAGSDASVQVTITAQDKTAAGQYFGVLTARSSNGTVSTRTALSVYQEEEKYELTVNLIDRDGNAPTSSFALLVDLDRVENNHLVAHGEKIRVPRGRYALHGNISTHRDGQEPTVSLISHPELQLDRDAVQTLDARVGKPMSITTDNLAARGGEHSVGMVSKISDCSCTYSMYAELDARFGAVFAATVPGTSSTSFLFLQSRQAYEPRLELFAQTAQPFEVPALWVNESPPAGRGALPVVYGGAGTPEDLAKIDARGKLVLFQVPEGIAWEEILLRTAAIKDAGGEMAMVTLADPALAGLAGGENPMTDPALPTMVGVGPTVQRFVDVVKAESTQASYVSTPVPNLRYELAYGAEHQLNTDQVHQPKTRDLFAVRAAYHDNAVNAVHSVAAVPGFAETIGGGISWFLPVHAGRERTEYFTPGTWEMFEQAGPSNIAIERLRFEAGRYYDIAWNKAVAGPSLRGVVENVSNRPLAWRKDDAIDVILPMFADSAGRPRMPWTAVGDSGSISLYRNGQHAGTVPVPDTAVFEVPDAVADYRLVAEADRKVEWWPLSTKVTAVWTFRSSAADDGNALPMLTARFDPAVDLQNRAPVGGDFSFPVYVERQDKETVDVTAFTVDVSYDDGRTWRPAIVRAVRDHWKISVNHTATGFVSLRAKATDAEGNTVEQTVLRAYEIGGTAGRRGAF